MGRSAGITLAARALMTKVKYRALATEAGQRCKSPVELVMGNFIL